MCHCGFDHLPLVNSYFPLYVKWFGLLCFYVKAILNIILEYTTWPEAYVSLQYTVATKVEAHYCTEFCSCML